MKRFERAIWLALVAALSCAAGAKMSSAGSSTGSFEPPLVETQGGTHQTAFTTGDILYASATNVLSKLPIGTTNQILRMSGGIPNWESGHALQSTDTIAWNGDTILQRDAANDLAQINGANAQKNTVYNTFTSTTNFERNSIDWQGVPNVANLHNEYGSAGGSPRTVLVGGESSANTSGGTWNGIEGQAAYAQASTNAGYAPYGQPSIVSPGPGACFFTIVSGAGCANKTFTVSLNGGSDTFGVSNRSVTATDTTNFTNSGTASVEATNLATYLNTVDANLFTATAVSATVFIQPAPGFFFFQLSTNAGGANATATNFPSMATCAPQSIGGSTPLVEVVAPLTQIFCGMSAAPSAASQFTTGGNVVVVPGMGTCNWLIQSGTTSGATFTVVVNGTSTTLTDGTDFTHSATTTVEATNLGNAVSAKNLGCIVQVSGSTVELLPSATTYSLSCSTNAGGGNATATNSAYGNILFGGANSAGYLAQFTSGGSLQWGKGNTFSASTPEILLPSDQGGFISVAVPAATGNGNGLSLAASAATTTGHGGLFSAAGGAASGTNQTSGGFFFDGGASTGNAVPTDNFIKGAPCVSGGASGSGANASVTLVNFKAVQNNPGLNAGSTYYICQLGNVTFADGGTAGSASDLGVVLGLTPTLNYTAAGSPQESWTGLLENVTATSLPLGGTMNLCDFQLATKSILRVNFTSSTAGTVDVWKGISGSLSGTQSESVYWGPNSAKVTYGVLRNSLTLSTGSATTNLGVNVPAGSVVYATSTRVTTGITTAATFNLEDSAGLFYGGTVANTVNSTGTYGGPPATTSGGTTLGPNYYNSAQTMKIVCNATPGAGVVEVIVWYYTITAPTS